MRNVTIVLERSPGDGADISIIVPVFNEADALISVCQDVRRELTRIGITWELIFIDDGSTDSTDAILEQLAEEDQRVRIIHFKRNLGQTAAMMAGFDYARGEVIIPLDGDGQNDPADAYFVREVDSTPFQRPSLPEGFVAAKFRDGRDIDGNLSYVGERDGFGLLKDLPVWDVVTNQTLVVSDLRR